MPPELQSIRFDPADPKAALSALPQAAAVFALYGEDSRAEPYIGRTPNLRGRLERLLQPSLRHPRRLQLAGMVRRIEWQLTGSEFESLLLQFELLQTVYGAKAPEQTIARMHLRHPAFVRFLGGNPYPRVTVTYRPSLREADWAYGPFPSRAAAERFSEEALKLFLLRRCTFDLDPDPNYPGCVYSEMKMCLAPCYKGCTDERYAEESAAVENFLATRGESRLVTLRAQRDQASKNLEFESAAGLHTQVQRVEAVRSLAAEIVRPLSRLRAVILQASANPGEVAVFLFENGRLLGPVAFSTLGMRIQNEQSGSTSWFAQPMAVEAVPETVVRGQGPGVREQGTREQGSEGAEKEASTEQGNKGEEIQGLGTRDSGTSHQATRDQASPAAEPQGAPAGREGTGKRVKGTASLYTEVLKGTGFSPYVNTSEKGGALAPEEKAPAKLSRGLLESRLESVFAELSAPAALPSSTVRQGHLSLLKRWYYRPETRREGEIFFPDAEDRWPIKSILRGIGRVAAKTLSQAQHS